MISLLRIPNKDGALKHLCAARLAWTYEFYLRFILTPLEENKIKCCPFQTRLEYRVFMRTVDVIVVYQEQSYLYHLGELLCGGFAGRLGRGGEGCRE